MYVVKNWNKEVIKWMAVAMCLAMVGIAFVPGIYPTNWYFTLAYHPEGAAIAAASTAYESIIIAATTSALIACTGGIGLAGALALSIMVSPTLLE